MTDFTPSDSQARAIAAIKDWFESRTREQQVCRLFGYAGSGKSTVLKTNSAFSRTRAIATATPACPAW